MTVVLSLLRSRSSTLPELTLVISYRPGPSKPPCPKSGNTRVLAHSAANRIDMGMPSRNHSSRGVRGSEDANAAGRRKHPLSCRCLGDGLPEARPSIWPQPIWLRFSGRCGEGIWHTCSALRSTEDGPIPNAPRSQPPCESWSLLLGRHPPTLEFSPDSPTAGAEWEPRRQRPLRESRVRLRVNGWHLADGPGLRALAPDLQAGFQFRAASARVDTPTPQAIAE